MSDNCLGFFVPLGSGVQVQPITGTAPVISMKDGEA